MNDNHGSLMMLGCLVTAGAALAVTMARAARAAVMVAVVGGVEGRSSG